MGLIRAASALAVAEGREYVTADDVALAAEPVLAHRLLLEPDAEVTGTTAAAVVRELVDVVPVPLGDEADVSRSR